MSVLVHVGGGGAGGGTALSTPTANNDTLTMSSMGSPPSNHTMHGPPHILPDTDVDAPMPSDLTHSTKGRLAPFSLSCLQTPGTPGTQFSTCFGLPYQDHNYGAPPPFTPPSTPPHSTHPKLNGHYGIDDVSANTTVVTSDVSPAENNGRSAQPEPNSPSHMGIDTGKTRCICDFEHDDGYMICCDRCGVWQHVDCMGLDRNTIPDAYFCELCEPRKLDKHRAVVIQTKKRQFLKSLLDSSATETEDETPQGKRRKANKFGRKKKDKLDMLSYTNGTKVVENSNHKCAKTNKHTPCKEDHPKPLKTLSQNTSPSPKKISTKRGSRSSRPDYSLATSPIRLDWSGTGSDHSMGADAGSTYEEAEFNQYSIAVETLLATGKLNGQLTTDGHSDAGSVTLAQLRDQLCRVTNIAPNVKGIEVVENTLPGQPLIEYKGKVALRDQFDKHHNIYSSYEPFVLLYTKFADMDVCIDAQNYGCDARFIRRSCSPNAEVRHFVEGADIHFYIVSIKAIAQGEEVTIPFDFDYSQCSYEVKCTCSRPKCPVQKSHHKLNSSHKSESKKKNKKLKRGSLSEKAGVLVTSPLHSDLPQPNPKSPTTILTKAARKRRLSPLKIQPKSEPEDMPHPLSSHKPHKEHHMKMSPVKSDQECSKPPSTPATPLTDNDKKMTREEKKMEAIIRAFERLEKREERRKESIARIHHDSDAEVAKEAAGKIKSRRDTSKSVKEESEEEVLMKPKRNRRKSRGDTEEEEVKEEEDEAHTVVDEDTVDVDLKHEVPDHTAEVKSEPIEHLLQPALLKAATKLKKGKRKGRSLPASRRQSRAGSGTTPATESCLSSEESSTQPPDTPSTAPSTLPPQNAAFKFPKTKKHLMNEWLNGQQQEASSRPLTVHTDCTEPPSHPHDDDAHFVRCTPSPHTSSLSHLLRRNSTSALGANPRAVTSLPVSIDHGLGSAKKRWLRQAMIDHEPNHLSPSGGASPSDNCNNSPNDSPTDFVTPLKKRRLARESLSGESPVAPPTVTTSLAALPDDEAHVGARDDHMFSPPHALIQCVGSPSQKDTDEACGNGSSGQCMGGDAAPCREIDFSSPQPGGSVVGGSPCTSGPGPQWGEDYEMAADSEVGTSSSKCHCDEAHIDSSSVGAGAIVCSVTGDRQCARTVCGADNATSSSSSSLHEDTVGQRAGASQVHSTVLSSSGRGGLCDSTQASITNSTDPGPDGACSSSSVIALRQQHPGTSPYSSDISSSASQLLSAFSKISAGEELVKCESSCSVTLSTEVGSSNLKLSREEGELDSSYSDTEAGGEPTVSCSWVDERENEALAKVESEKEEGEITDDEEGSEEEEEDDDEEEVVVEEPVVEIDVVEEQVDEVGDVSLSSHPTSSTEISSSDHHLSTVNTSPGGLLSEQFPITGGRIHGLLSPPPLSSTEPPPAPEAVADSSSSSLSVDCAADLVSSSEVSDVLSPSSSYSALHSKKKVSLLEYRKRIKIQSSRESPGSSSSTLPEYSAPIDRPTPTVHVPTLAPLPMFGDMLRATSPKPSSSKGGEKSEQDVRWNASATLAERMREQTPLSLTERLRKEFGVETSEPEETVDSSDESPPPPPPPMSTALFSSQPSSHYSPLPPPPVPPMSLTPTLPTPPPTMPLPPPPPPMPPSLLLAPGSHLPGSSHSVMSPTPVSAADNSPVPLPPLMSLPAQMPSAAPGRLPAHLNGDEACSSNAPPAAHHSPNTSSSSAKLPSPPHQHVSYSNGMAVDSSAPPPAQTREVSSTGGDLYPPSSVVRGAPRLHYNTPTSYH